MAVKIFAVFVFLVVPAALAQNGHFGYDYRAPAMPFPLPSNLRPNINQLQQSYYNNAHELQNGFVPSPIYHQYNEAFHNKNQQFQAQQQSSQMSHYNYQGYQNAQSSYQNGNYNGYNQNLGSSNLLSTQNSGSSSQDQGYQNAQSSYQNGNYNGYNQNLGSSNLLSTQNSGSSSLLSIQNAQQTGQSNPAQNPSLTNPQPQQPIITKHIYFHLPPEDQTATAAPVTPTPPKKTYNFIFIKLPSHKFANAARVQQLINQQAAADSKTLIYVLVKKPELHPPQPVTSKPEVFFVKYKDPKTVARAENTGSLHLAPLIQGSASGLLPGQINGHGYK